MLVVTLLEIIQQLTTTLELQHTTLDMPPAVILIMRSRQIIKEHQQLTIKELVHEIVKGIQQLTIQEHQQLTIKELVHEIVKELVQGTLKEPEQQIIQETQHLLSLVILLVITQVTS